MKNIPPTSLAVRKQTHRMGDRCAFCGLVDRVAGPLFWRLPMDLPYLEAVVSLDCFLGRSSDDGGEWFDDVRGRKTKGELE